MSALSNQSVTSTSTSTSITFLYRFQRHSFEEFEAANALLYLTPREAETKEISKAFRLGSFVLDLSSSSITNHTNHHDQHYQNFRNYQRIYSRYGNGQ